jgi:exopolysaccharide production protein ExoY
MSTHLSRTRHRAAARMAPLGGSRPCGPSSARMDILMAGSFFVFFGWAYALIWAGVLLTSGSPAIYMQPRYGKDGKVFRFLKFRTMVPDADSVLARHLRENEAAWREWQVFQKLEHDPRITRFGAFLRKYSIDEFPQFWNVLRGDMSMVGPRPCMFAQKDLYGPYWHVLLRGAPGHHRPLADQRTQRGELPPPRGDGRRVRGHAVGAARHPDRAQDLPRRDGGARLALKSAGPHSSGFPSTPGIHRLLHRKNDMRIYVAGHRGLVGQTLTRRLARARPRGGDAKRARSSTCWTRRRSRASLRASPSTRCTWPRPRSAASTPT